MPKSSSPHRQYYVGNVVDLFLYAQYLFREKMHVPLIKVHILHNIFHPTWRYQVQK